MEVGRDGGERMEIRRKKKGNVRGIVREHHSCVEQADSAQQSKHTAGSP